MTKKTKKQIDDSPFAGGVLYEKVKSGEEWFKYSYPQHGLPKTSVPSAPMCSPLAKYCEQQIIPCPKKTRKLITTLIILLPGAYYTKRPKAAKNGLSILIRNMDCPKRAFHLRPCVHLLPITVNNRENLATNNGL